VIVAHHMGEHLLLPALLASAGAGSVWLAVGRVRLGRFLDRLRR
jgi:hypothetical protein